jgi:predicted DCC family thiol-disulfide oxidoreductase YuxK
VSQARSTLIFDGACGVCRTWVDYWRGLTVGKVDYRPYQEAAAEFPAIPAADFQHAIQLIEPDGSAYRGAAATFRLLRNVPGHRLWWRLYAHLPGFAGLSERAYGFFARHRGLLAALTRVLWGTRLEPECYALVSATFLRLFGAIYVAAFASLAVQIVGLVGRRGILPVVEFLPAVRDALGPTAYVALPTLFWLNASDTALVAACVAGVVLGALIVVDRWTRFALCGAYVLYLSLVYAGQEFMYFQWDVLLTEAGFLAIFLTGGSRMVVWLFRLLLFRYVFLAGVAKLLSGDPTWRHLTALDYHFWTQPLPTPLAWYAAQLPQGLLAAGTAATLLVEVGLVFLIFLPRRPRAVAAFAIIAFQLLIALTGNYNFFNLLTILLCVTLFDDAAVRRALPGRLAAWMARRAPRPGRAATTAAAALAVVAVPVGLDRIVASFTHEDVPVLGALTRVVEPLHIVNTYGLFAVMTTTRPEIIVEGSEDGATWRAYVFRYKPGPLARPLRWNIPHQPRLDWQMWFAALGDADASPWFARLLERLLQGSPDVLALLAGNPFPDHPPRYVRAELYAYRFADPALRRRTGDWWVREPIGPYFAPVTLGDYRGLDGSGPETDRGR